VDMIHGNGSEMTYRSAAGVLCEAEEHAYVLLEECRIRVEHISPPGPGSADLRELHRRLGLAGYHTSTAMFSEVREQCLARARALAADPDGDDSRDALEARIRRALEAIGDGLDAGSSDEGDHLHLAQAHASKARSVLRGPVLERAIETLP
jgi:hypothetical protein